MWVDLGTLLLQLGETQKQRKYQNSAEEISDLEGEEIALNSEEDEKDSSFSNFQTANKKSKPGDLNSW